MTDTAAKETTEHLPVKEPPKFKPLKFESELKRRKIQFHVEEWNEKQLGKLRSVKLNFTPTQWVGIVDKEGPWLPMCCSNLSEARDIFIRCLREGGWIDGADLKDVVELVGEHDGFVEFFKNKKKRAKHRKDPMAKLFDIWDIVKDDLAVCGEPRTLDPSNWEDAATLLERGLLSFRWAMRVKHEYTTEKAKEDGDFHSQLNKLSILKNVIPAVRTLSVELPRLTPPPIIGFGLVKKGTREFGETRAGNAIYRTKERAKEVLELWSKATPKVLEQFEIKRVRLYSNDIEFLEELWPEHEAAPSPIG